MLRPRSDSETDPIRDLVAPAARVDPKPRFWNGRRDDPQRDAVELRKEVVRLYAEGKLADAAVVARRLLDWQRFHLGRNHADYGRGLLNLAMLYQKLGDTRAATALVEELVGIRRTSVGTDHPDTAEAESLLGLLQASRAESPEPPAPVVPEPVKPEVTTPTAGPNVLKENPPHVPRTASPSSPPRTRNAPMPAPLDTFQFAFGSRGFIPLKADAQAPAPGTAANPIRARPTPNPFAALGAGLAEAAAELRAEADMNPPPTARDSTPPPQVDPRALAVLDRVLALRYVGPPGAGANPIQEVHEAARRLRAALLAGDRAEASRLAEGDHPFAALLAFAAHHGSLSDTAWDAHHAAVSTAFGYPLALAVGRGRIA